MRSSFYACVLPMLVPFEPFPVFRSYREEEIYFNTREKNTGRGWLAQVGKMRG